LHFYPEEYIWKWLTEEVCQTLTFKRNSNEC
jgi:hypothetical protein